jgi:hypothetical protein
VRTATNSSAGSGRRRATQRLLIGASAASVVAGIAACGAELEDPPEPARTQTPARSAGKVAWLGPRFGELRFHSVARGPRRVVVVNYGDPRPPDPGSGDWWHFPLTVSTAPRRPQTRGRLQRSLGAGKAARLGTRYGCRRADGPARVAVLTATRRLEITGVECPDLLRASRRLRLG